MIPSYLKPYHTNISNLIRLGRNHDGGYVIDKRVIKKTKAVIDYESNKLYLKVKI